MAGHVGGAERDALEDHAAGCRLCRGVMVALTRGEAAPVAIPTDRIGRYEIRDSNERAIRAFDPVTQREVSIRVFHDVANRDQILAEAKVLATIDNPNIVRVLDAGPIGNGLYVVSEPVIGTRFEIWVKRTGELTRRRKAMRQIAHALTIMHARGVMHRNVKLDNVVVEKDGHATLVGFGPGTEPATPRTDQQAWWEMAKLVMGDQFPNRRAIRRGLTTGYKNMNAAARSLGATTKVTWLALGLVLALGVSGGISGARRGRVGETTASSDGMCGEAVEREWTQMRPAIARFVTDAKLMDAIDGRARREVEIREQTCTNGKAYECSVTSWYDMKVALARIHSSDRDTVYDAIDYLALAQPPDTCVETELAAYPVSNDRQPSIEIEINALEGQLDQLPNLADKIRGAQAYSTEARWHLALAEAQADHGKPNSDELALARQLATKAKDDPFRLNVMVEQIAYGSTSSPALETEAEQLAMQVRNPGRAADLYLVEAMRRRDDQLDDRIAKLQRAIAEIDKAALSPHAIRIQAERQLGTALLAKSDLPGARAAFDHAVEGARVRYGMDSYDELMVRDIATMTHVWSDPDHAVDARPELLAIATKIEKLVPNDDSSVGLVFRRLCMTDIDLKNVTDSCDVALSHAERGLRESEQADYLNDAGHMKLLANDPVGALAAFERAIRLADNNGSRGEGHLLAAIALHRLHRDASAYVKAARAELPPGAPALAALDREFK
ncbi:MAG: protein kinase [Kofleriaceae bacterium]